METRKQKKIRNNKSIQIPYEFIKNFNRSINWGSPGFQLKKNHKKRTSNKNFEHKIFGQKLVQNRWEGR